MIPLLLVCIGLAAEDDYRCGMELMQAERLEDARSAFLRGQEASPSDKRFPIALAGVEYRRQNYDAAKHHLKRALFLDRRDAYANDFLATLYFLEGRVESALQHWNLAGKPRIENVVLEPEQPAIAAVLLDRSLAFAPASVLTLEQYRLTRAWLDHLELPLRRRIEIVPRPEKDFDVKLQFVDAGSWARRIAWLRSLPFQAVNADFHNLGGSAANWTNMLRWDAQKRRIRSAFSAPVARNPRWRFRTYGDFRKEVWNFGDQDFRFEKAGGAAEFSAIPRSWLSWRTGMQLSSERLWGAPEFPHGVALKYRAGANWRLLDLPDHRFSIESQSLFETGRIFASPRRLFSRGEISVDARWTPRIRGSDYEARVQIHGGKAFGSLPLDELFMLGADRDNHLWLRGHSGTRRGKKGSALIGSGFVLANLEGSKQVYGNAFLGLQVGPFVDIARIRDVMGRNAAGPVIVDPGLQAKLRLLGNVTVTLSYGRNLHSGKGVFYSRADQ